MTKHRPKKESTAAIMAEHRYGGKYVAVDTANGNEVVAFGQDVGKVVTKARGRGVRSPAIMFVPKEGTAYIY